MVGNPGDARALVRATLTWSLRWVVLAAIAIAAAALAAPEGDAPAAAVPTTAQTSPTACSTPVVSGYRSTGGGARGERR